MWSLESNPPQLCTNPACRDGEYFTYSYGLVFTNRLFSLILSSVLVWVFERESLTLSTVRGGPGGFVKVGTDHQSNQPQPHPPGAAVRVQLPLGVQHALVLVPVRGPLLRHLPHSGRYTHTSTHARTRSCTRAAPSTPKPLPPHHTQTLSKSFKLVPIMLMGKMLTNKNYPTYEYLTAVAIGLGNTLFMIATENLDLGVDSFGQVRRLEAWVHRPLCCWVRGGRTNH